MKLNVDNVFMLFPGQGSQYIGMINDFYKNFPQVKQLFEEAEECLDHRISKLIFDGSEADLKLTQNAQPAILIASIAIYRVLKELYDVQPKLLAGHSLGEYSALVAADALEFGDAVKLVRQRGIFMQEAVPKGVGTMAAILGLDDEVIVDICSDLSKPGHIVEGANFNCPGQVVISGHVKAVNAACEAAKAQGAKRCLPLNVSAPFHCSLLTEAGERLAEVLKSVRFRDPQVPYVANVDAEIYQSSVTTAKLLEKQVSASVKWRQCIETMLNQSPEATFIEVGPGSVLAGMVKKCDGNARIHFTNNLENTRSVFEA